MVTLEEAVDIGREELERMDFRGLKKGLDIDADEENTRWRKYVTSTPSVRKSIKGTDPASRGYYAIYFGPKELQLGGDAWVLVDRKSGKVLHVLFGR